MSRSLLRAAALAGAAGAAALAAWASPAKPALSDPAASLEEEEEEQLGHTRVRHRTAVLGGVRLHFIEAGAPDAPLVLLLHGFPDCYLSWAAQLPALVAAGFRVVAPDLRGYGRSSAPRGSSSYSSDAVVGDLVGLLDLLAVPQAACVVGHDWGGAAAWHLAARAPERLRKLAILNCPHPLVFARTLRSSRAQRRASWYMACFQVPLLPELLLRAGDCHALRQALATEPQSPASETLTAQYVSLFQRSGFHGPLSFYRAAARGLWRMQRTPIDCPVLVLWGTGDPHLTEAMAEPPAQLVPRARVLRFDDGPRHWVHWDASEAVNRELVAFLRDSKL